MPITVAFDVYGTLIDTQGIAVELEAFLGQKAKPFSLMWRDKQLEYSFRRGLMGKYENFSVCTRDALNYTCQHFEVGISDEQKTYLLSCYRSLPAFEDVVETLTQLQSKDYRLFAFSNGDENAVDALLVNAGIRDLFLGIVSVDDIQTFKPSPATYRYFLEKSEAAINDTWLVSSNPFDVMGAVSTGLNAAWVQRSPQAIFDPWGIEPTVVINSLSDLPDQLIV